MFALQRIRVFFVLAALAVSLAAISPATALAQYSGGNTTPVGDKSLLRPPAGARVAIFEFEDLECPDCARAYPLLKEAAAKYDIPWVKHDFPLPFHAWSFQAAVNARWFDSKSKKAGRRLSRGGLCQPAQYCQPRRPAQLYREVRQRS